MALKKTAQTKFGIDVQDAYYRVEQVYIEPKDKIRFMVKGYKDISYQAIDEQQYVCDYDPSGANAHTQAYKHLKSLDEFASATDV